MTDIPQEWAPFIYSIYYWSIFMLTAWGLFGLFALYKGVMWMRRRCSHG